MQRRMVVPAIVLALVVTSLGGVAPSVAEPDRSATPAGTATSSAPTPRTTFPDVPEGHRFAEAIGWMADNALAGGYPDGGFHPTAPVSRQAAAAFLARYAGHDHPPPTCTTAPFPDVPPTHRFCAEIHWLAEQGIASGYPDGRFHPTEPVSRQAIAAFLHRLRHATPTPTATCPDGAPFPDVATTHAFCGEIHWLAQRGIAGGYPDGTFQPTAPVSRQAAAAFLHALDPGCTPATEHCPRPAVHGDYDGDRKGDPVYVVYDGDTGSTWYRGDDPTPLATARPIEVPVGADLDGDGRWEIAWVDLGTGTWTTTGARGTFPFEAPACGDVLGLDALPVVGDFDHDGGDDPAWYCPFDGTWYFDDGSTLLFGEPYRVRPDWAPEESPSATYPISYHDVPVVLADDEGRDVPGLYRPTDGTFHRAGDLVPHATTSALGAPIGGRPPMIWRLHAEGFEQVGSPGWQPDRCCEWAAPIDHDGDGVLALGAITKDHGGARTWEIDGAPDLDLVPDHVSGGGLYVATTVPAATFLDLPRLSIIAGDCLVYEICPPDPG